MIDEYGKQIALKEDADGKPIYLVAATMMGNVKQDREGRPNTYETRNNIDYFILDENVKLQLAAGTNYYLVIDYQTPSGIWINSHLNDICSIISDPFTVTEAHLVVDELNNSLNSEIEIDCNEESADLSKMTISITVPDFDGGVVYVNDLNFDWYLKGKIPAERSEEHTSELQ